MRCCLLPCTSNGAVCLNGLESVQPVKDVFIQRFPAKFELPPKIIPIIASKTFLHDLKHEPCIKAHERGKVSPILIGKTSGIAPKAADIKSSG